HAHAPIARPSGRHDALALRLAALRLGAQTCAAAAIEADARRRDVADRFVINIRDAHAAEIVDGAIVEETVMVPMAAEEADAEIAEAVVDAAIEADGRAPIAGMPEIAHVDPTPV